MRRERRRRERAREEKIYEEKHKHIHTLLSHQSSDVFILFCSPLIGAHGAVRRREEKNEKCRNDYVLPRYPSLSLSTSPSHLLSAIVVFFFYIHTCLIIVTSSSPSPSSSSSMHIRYVLFLMGNLITCTIYSF